MSVLLTFDLVGLAQPHKYKLNLTLDSPEVVRMRERCNNFVPGLENAEYDPDAPLVQGLRPFRGSNVRVERELRTRKDGSSSRIIHSYGQGGAGFSLSFGCANDVRIDFHLCYATPLMYVCQPGTGSHSGIGG